MPKLLPTQWGLEMMESEPGWFGRLFNRQDKEKKSASLNAIVIGIVDTGILHENSDQRELSNISPNPIVSKEHDKHNVPLVLSAPGAKAKQVLAFLYSKKAYETIFEPTIEDMRHEYCEALSKGEAWHAKWIHIRCIAGLIWTNISLAISVLRSLISKSFHPGGPSSA